MENVLFVPIVRQNWFSVVSVLDKSMKFSSSKNNCEFVRCGLIKARGRCVNQLFKMILYMKKPEKACIGEVNLLTKDSLHI